MKHANFLLGVICFFAATTYGQQDNNWNFGRKAGLNFSTGRATAITNSAMTTMEGSASISDEDGQLLFYTNGIDVWNKNNQKMPHGTGLKGDQSSTQGTVIVPKPGSSTRYYIFAADKEGGANGLTYSEVDMAADNGKGDVIAFNAQLVTPVSEKVAAVYHANGKDIWVTTHHWGSNAFYSYLITASGVNTSPVISNTGLVIEGDALSGHYAGWMAVSPDGKRLASANGLLAVELFDFDNATGIVSNAVTVKSPARCYGAEFSANSKLLYVTSDNALYQYKADADNVASTETEIAKLDVASSIKLAPDSKIYVVSKYLSTKMSVINRPDTEGTGCNFEADGLDLGEGQTFVGLPNFLIEPFYLLSIKAVVDCGESQVAFTATGTAPSESITWDFGDGNQSDEMNTIHTYAATGTYIVKAKAKSNKAVRFYTKQVTVVSAPVANKPEDMITCGTPQATAAFNFAEQNSAILGTQPADLFTVTYYTSSQDANAGTNALSVNYTNTSSPQTIYAKVKSATGDCFAITSFTITATPSPEVIMEDTYSFCENSFVVIEAPKGYDGYVWLYNNKVISGDYRISANKAGEYTLRVTRDNNGMFCNTTKVITVKESEKPVIKKIEVTDWTDRNNTIEIVMASAGDYEYSIDGTTWQESPLFENLEPGEYNITVRNSCGTAEGDALILMYPKYFTPNGDGYHDKWQVENAWKDHNVSVTVFDRYGQVLANFKGSSSGWDGTYNGATLPASDYWFVINRNNGKEYKGHFSLMR
ncbi:T9SS type B sorting domain-containing protein [Flavobacterium sp. DG1-102-2]|uniref:T9SS type B sorting domain-containing protein n=1 Tax=Flavobacterium sp. DG1-102-2 TaxID=3081663 RepID=UPI0029498C3C|nr:T9SS type B sorting domain-containing protein [Flavobacterium sp. DG1-102-2]MDV6169622.1 T9SS type B sorting domain-containing protein [Flavobacterium sp. DG1-102-2]